MGICLDTEQSEGSQAFEEGRETWVENSARDPRTVSTPVEGQFPMHNATNVQFEAPKVPVIFVLGGPGSGKVTHCDNIMQEKKGIVHINMTDLLQQYAIGNEMQDFSILSSKTVTEVLMLEMKMAPKAKTYIVSGYPRNMRDVVEYSEKIQMISGVILVSWRQKVLERQIDYGAKLGQVVLSLARMELNNFYKNVMPAADYFDQSNLLVAINGERHPSEVYKDFKNSVMKNLGAQENPPVFENSVESFVPINVTPELQAVNKLPVAKIKNSGTVAPQTSPEQLRPQTQVLSVNKHSVSDYQSPVKIGWPSVLWVIGGPGSNKSVLCDNAIIDTNWEHISVGRLLRAAADVADKRSSTDTQKIKECITNGDLVPLDIVLKIIESHMGASMSASGILLDGFPRDITQATEFESKFKQKPNIILLDCSKLQLGRGRLDDSVTAFRRRLEIFRQSSLPMLKTMDNIGRLTIVDGDTDTAPVQEDFKNVIHEHMQYITISNAERNPPAPNGIAPNGNVRTVQPSNGHISNGGPIANGHIHDHNDAVLHDLESDPNIHTISKTMSNGVLANGIRQVTKGTTRLGGIPVKVAAISNGVVRNKFADLDSERQDNIRSIYGHVNVENHI